MLKPDANDPLKVHRGTTLLLILWAMIGMPLFCVVAYAIFGPGIIGLLLGLFSGIVTLAGIVCHSYFKSSSQQGQE